MMMMMMMVMMLVVVLTMVIVMVMRVMIQGEEGKFHRSHLVLELMGHMFRVMFLINL